MAYKMKGFSGFGNSPAKQKVKYEKAEPVPESKPVPEFNFPGKKMIKATTGKLIPKTPPRWVGDRGKEVKFDNITQEYIPINTQKKSPAKQKYDANGTDERAYNIDQNKYDKWRGTEDINTGEKGNAPNIRYLGAKENKKHLESYLKFKKSGGKKNIKKPGTVTEKTGYDKTETKTTTIKKSPAKQKNKGKMQGPIPEQNLKLQPGENDGTWIYGRGYKGDDPKEGIKEMKADEKRLNKNKKIKPNSGTDFVRRERIIDYDERAGYLEQNDLMDIEGDNSPEANKKRKKLKAAIKTLDREAQIMRDRTDK